MKKILFFFYIFSLFLFSCQTSQDNKISGDFNSYRYHSARLVTEFLLDSQVVHLDSALLYIDAAYEKYKQHDFNLSMRKLIIFSLKHDLSKAIKFIKTLDTSLFMFSYNKNLLLYRFEAMQAQQKGNWDKKNFFLDKIVSQLTPIINDLNKKEIDSIISLPDIDSILYTKNYNPHLSKLIHYYYYRAQKEGKDKIKMELDSFQNAIHGNKEYFDMLKEFLDIDFMTFAGI